MRKKIPEPQFIVNEKGKQIGVILDVRFYRAMTEELEDLHDTLKAERRLARSKKSYSLEEVHKKLFTSKKI